MKPERKLQVGPVRVIAGPDGATPHGHMTLTGIIRTTRGLAVATVELDADGSLVAVKLGNSQDSRHGKPFIAMEHKKLLTAAAAKL